jgi:hypothetical protein
VPPVFRQPATKSYPLSERLDLFNALGDRIDQLVLRALPRKEQDGSAERMLLGSWAHAHTTYGAIMVLAHEQDPDGQTVAMLSRPLFEAMVDLYWIAAQPVKAQELAVKNYRLLRIVVPEHYNARRKPGDPEMPIDPNDLADRQALAKAFGTKAQKHWTTLDLRSRADAVDADVLQDVPGELSDRYDEDNYLANLLLHGSPMAINDRLEGSAHGVTVKLGASSQHLANGLRHAYWSYYRIGWLLVGRLVPDAREGLFACYRQGWPKLQTITAGALKAAGRNGACPCDSGRKTKDCHGAL